MASPYAYDQAADFEFEEITSGQLVSGTDFDVVLIDREFPGGLLADRAFVTAYEGSIEIDIDQNRNVTFSVSVEHVLADGTSFESRRRGFFSRVTRGQEFYLPLNVFSSHSVVPSADYAADLFAQPSQIRIMLHINANNDANIERIAARGSGVWFHQLADPPSLPEPDVPYQPPDFDGSTTLKARIDQSLPLAGFDVRQWRVRGPSTVEVRFAGYVRSRAADVLVPVADVVLTTIDTDSELLTRSLISALNAVPDVYPQLERVTVDYSQRDNQDVNRRYTRVTVRCHGVG